MLQSLERLALVRQCDPAFNKLWKSVQQVKTKLQLERLHTMKETTIDSFFLPASATVTCSAEVIDLMDADDSPCVNPDDEMLSN
jgi:hypothetical protein